MYRIHDKGEAVLRLQIYLDGIRGRGERVYQSESYDERTREAVRRFQESRSLPVTGVTDYLTYTMIYEEYLRRVAAEEGRSLWGGSIPLPLSEGAVHSDMVHLNELIAYLSGYYRIPHGVRITNRFSTATGDAVRELRRIYGLPDGRWVDNTLYGIMRGEREALSRRSEN